MIRTLALIACLAGAAHGSDYLPWDTQTLNIKWGVGSGTFITMPVTKDNATAQGWVQYSQSCLSDCYSALELYCAVDAFDACLWYDDTGYLAGVQTAFNQAYVSDAVYDWEEQGFTSWTVELSNGTSNTYWAIQQLYLSCDDLATSADTRVANRNSSRLLQFDNIWVSGFDGELTNISTNIDTLIGSGTYTEQACIPSMGHHYYYNMTTSLGCLKKQILSWFPLVYSGQLTGVGFMGFFKYSADHTYCERPSQTAVKLIVTSGPDCLYDMADSPGPITSHHYFVDPAWTMTCVVESSSS